MSGTIATLASAGSLAQSVGQALGFLKAPLVLGDFVFANFEIPDKINFGGQQQLTVHKLPGGKRIIDAMGRDDAPIAWDGVMLSADADTRAQRLDEMRVAGQPVALLFGSQSYTVVIADFAATYMRPGRVGYHISCAILRDNSAAPDISIVGAAVQIYSDVNTALGYLSAITTPPPSGDPTSAVTKAQASAQLAAANNFHLGSATQAQAVADLATANAAMQAGLISSGGIVQGAAGRAPAGSVAATWPDFLVMVTQARTLALLAATAPFVARSQVNAVAGAA